MEKGKSAARSRTDAEDRQLVSRIAEGDAEAGKAFFLRYRQGAFRVAYRLLGNEADALDVVEDAFVKLLRAAGSFRGAASARTWFYRIVTNTGLDARRKRGRFVSIESAKDDEGAGMADFLPSREESPDEAAVRKETGERIQEAVAALGEKHRLVFILAVIEELSYKETAEILEISIGTVMSRLFYARRYLRETLKGYLGAGDE